MLMPVYLVLVISYFNTLACKRKEKKIGNGAK